MVSVRFNLSVRLLFFSLRLAPGKLKTVTTCSRFIRALVAACPGNYSVYWNTFVPRNNGSCSSLLSFFKEGKWPNGARRWISLVWRGERKKRLKFTRSLMTIQRDKNFDFKTFDHNGGNISEVYVVRIRCFDRVMCVYFSIVNLRPKLVPRFGFW